MTKEVFVAQYAYDTKGRLRAEWNPQISPVLKTTYGYDAEGHVTSITGAGQQGWALTYGTIAGDPNAGRLLKATRAQPRSGASEEEVKATLKEQQELPTKTEAPKLSGSPVVGITMGVSNGKWGNAPIAYGYQWEDCNSAGKECTAITGATNANYKVAESDVGHTLIAVVTVTNGGGSVTAETSASASVHVHEIAEYALPSESRPFGITVGSDSNLWFTDSGTGKAGKITTGGGINEYAAEKDEPEGITSGPDKNLWFVEHSVRHVNHMTTSGSLTVYTLARTSTYNVGITAGSDENLWFTESEAGYIGKINTKDEVLGEYKLPTSSEPYGIASGPDKNLWYTDYGTGYIGKITTAGAITEYKLPSGSDPYSIVAGSDGNLWYTDYGTGYIGKITTSGTITEYKLPAGSKPRGIAAGPSGEASLWFAESGTNKIGKITTGGTITEYELPSGSVPYSVVAGPDKNIWFTENGTNKIGKLTLTPTGGEAHTGGPGYTVEYRVPLSVTGRQAMTKEELAKWGQTKDLPTEATAIFPPDEPMGWPATDYKRASITYMDEEGRTVNSSSPSGAISTAEYNETNDVVRTLSADNRVAALKEGSKSAEASEKLDAKSTYNAEGTEMLETLGPEHNVKLTSGSEAQARDHVKYSYDEGAPEGKEHNGLVTKTTNAALVSGKEEDLRTTISSYGGQKGLGWTLRKPTSVTTDPAGLNFTKTTTYDESTGNVTETQSPMSTETNSPPAYASQWGAGGKENGQFNRPMYTAVDSSGNLWVADGYNNRIEKFLSSGTFLASYGEYGSSETEVQFKEPVGIAINQSTGNVYVGDQNNNRVVEMSSSGKLVRIIGRVGSGHAEFKEPNGIAIDPKGNIWVVDCGNDRVQELNENGEYQKEFGGKGSETGKFSLPEDIAFSGENIYITDQNNSRVEEFSEEGKKFVRAWGSWGAGNGKFEYPSGIAVGPNGNVYVTSGNNDPVQEFSPTGSFLLSFGAVGSGNGQLMNPKESACFQPARSMWPMLVTTG